MSIEQMVRAIVRDEVQAALAGMPAPSLEWLDSTEAAAVLGITVGHLHNLRQVVPSYKVGGRRRYRRDELDQYIQRQS